MRQQILIASAVTAALFVRDLGAASVFNYIDPPIDISQSGTDSWEPVDVSAWVPAGATGVIILEENESSSEYEFGVRKTGSGDEWMRSAARTIRADTHAWFMIGVDATREFELWQGSSNGETFLLGYTTAGVTFFDDAKNHSLSATGSWESIDISTDTGADTAIGAILVVQNTTSGSEDYALRIPGSSHNQYEVLRSEMATMAVVGLDGNEIFDMKIGDTDLDTYVVGYITDGVVFLDPPVDVSLGSTGSWDSIDISAHIGSDVVNGALIEQMERSDGMENAGVAYPGESYSVYQLTSHLFAPVHVDGSNTFEARIADTGVDFYLVGYTLDETDVNYRSIGTDTATLYSAGNASIPSGSSTVTFAGGASLPAATVGQGDELAIGADTFYILSRDSSTQVTIQGSSGSTHTSAAYTIQRAYNTFQAWETDREGDLVADDRREVGVAYNDGPFVFTSPLNLAASTTDATRYMKLTVAEGQRHDGTADSGAVIDCDGGFGASAINVNNPYTRIEGFEIKNIAGGNYHAVVFYTSGANDSLGSIASDLVVHDVQGYAVWFADTAGATMRNVITYDCGKPALAANGSIAYVESCTFDNTGTGYGLTSYDPSTIHVKNTISVGASSWDINLNGNTIGSFGYNLYSTLTGFNPASYEGGNQSPPADFDDLFVTTTEGSEDLHLEPEGHDAADNGLDLSANFTTDIDGQTWVAPWDIGADWIKPSGYRSIGTDAGTLYSAGTATINPDEVIVTFSGATLPANIGPGDELGIGAETFYLVSRDSDTQVTVQEPAATTHSSEAYTIARAYNTLLAWEDDRDGDLVGERRREIGVCYNDGIFTSPVTISGSTTNAAHFMTLTVAAGQRHNGIKDSGARIDAQGGWGAVNAITVEDEYTRIEWLEITDIYDSGDAIYFDDSPAADNGTVTGVFVHGFWQAGNAGVRTAAPNTTIRNSMFTGGTSQGIEVDAGGGIIVENCTLWGYWGGGHGIAAGTGSGSVSVTNTISVDHGGIDMYIETAGGATIDYFGYNLFSSHGGGFDPDDYQGNNQLPPQNLEHLFVDLSATDLHLEDSGHYAGNNGLDLSATFTDDIDGTTRVDAWDIGADEGVTGTEELDPKVIRWAEVEPQ
jgi:hypothetical protein